MDNSTQKKAIIIGAGPAGLTAAYQLLIETDIKPIILEESECVGGLSRTVEYKGNRIDIGGHRFFSKNKQVNEIWKQLIPIQGASSKDDLLFGIEKPLQRDGPDPEQVDRVLLVRNRVSRIFYKRQFFDYPLSIKPATLINLGLLQTIKAGTGYFSAILKKREENSLEDFYINRFGKPLYHMFFEDYTKKLWGVHPSYILPDWGVQRVKALSLKKALKEMFFKTVNRQYKSDEASLIEQFIYPKKGPGQLWEAMLDVILNKGGEIHFNTKVTGVKTHNNKIYEVICESSNDSLKNMQGDFFLSSMPVKDLINSMGKTVPNDISIIASNLPYRDFITVGLLVNKLKIKNTTKIKTYEYRVPDCWIYIQEKDVRIGRLQIFNNWSPYMVNDYENNIWIGLEYFCSEGDQIWNMSSHDFIRLAVNELDKINIVNKDDIIDAVYIRTKKAYPAYYGSYAQFNKIQNYLSHFSNLYCIGRNGQHRYNNMDHSMLTAIEAINLIKTGKEDKSILWKVNTEADYNE